MENKNPLVSVIMPTYNCGKYIVESINSVIKQALNDWEIQIVDDCSTDNTFEIIKPILDEYPNIHYYRLEKNSGPDVARTEAIKRATGKYCAFLDSDDLWFPNKLEEQIRFMEDNDAAFSCTAYKRIDDEGNDLHETIVPPKKTDYKKCIRLGNPIGNLTVVYNQERLGKFAVPRIRGRNDFALWLQILKKTDYCYGMPQTLSAYRIGRNDSVNANKKLLKQTKYLWQLYREIEKHNVVRSAFEIMSWAIVKTVEKGYRIVKRHE